MMLLSKITLLTHQ